MQTVTISDLRCEFLCNPLSVDGDNPRLSWKLEASTSSARQSMVRIRAFDAPPGGNKDRLTIWDSGWVVSSDPWLVYQGPRLETGRRVIWTVQVRCGDMESDWSAPAGWEWGPLVEEDWCGARWVGADYDEASRLWPAAFLRRQFHCDGGIHQGRLYVCGLGCSQVFINGHLLDDGLLDPTQSDYERFAYYQAYDATPFLTPGKNYLGIVLGDGWYNQDRVWTGKYYPRGASYGEPGVKLLLQVWDAAEMVFRIVSDDEWMYTLQGSIRANNVYAGESHDARLDLGDWTGSGASDEGWKPVRMGAVRSPQLLPQLIPPIRTKQSISPVSLHSPLPGVWIYDFGRNLAGVCRLRVNAPRGTELCLRFAEALMHDGTADYLSTGYVHTRVVQTDRYICRGGEVEVWEPRFTYHGFRYVELTGFPGVPSLSALEALTAFSDLEPAGAFTCSDHFINHLQEVALRTITSNLHGVITDCPARERCGWLGDAHLVSEAVIFNYDASNFLRKFQRDILGSLGTSQNVCGDYPADPRVPANIAPGKRRCQQGRPDWAAALILIPWNLYLYYGDTRTLTESYPAMKGLMAYWEEMARDGVLEDGFGDWCPPGGSPISKTCPPALTSTAYWYCTAGCMRKFASLQGYEADANHYAVLQRRIRRTFLKCFFDPVDNGFGSQTGDVMALACGLAPCKHRRDLTERLARRIREDGKGHFDTGIHGLRHLFDVLARYGQADACMNLLHQEGYPGFKHLFSLGATTFWETMYDPDEFAMGVDRSKNHPMQAAFAAWHYHGPGGLRPDPHAPGFEHFTLQPLLVGNLTHAEVSYESVRGRIVSKWTVENGMFCWDVDIPANASATLCFPERVKAHSLRLVDSPAKALPNPMISTPRGICWKLGNGRHHFEADGNW